MSLSGPAIGRTWTQFNISGDSCAVTLPIQPDRVWEDLERRMGKTPQIQVYQVCIIPKKTQGSNHCQRCFNKVLSIGTEYLCKCFFNWMHLHNKMALTLWCIVCRLMSKMLFLQIGCSVTNCGKSQRVWILCIFLFKWAERNQEPLIIIYLYIFCLTFI